VGPYRNQFALQPGVVEQRGLFLEEGFDFGVTETEAHELLKSLVHHLRAPFHAFALGQRTPFLHGVTAPHAGTEQSLVVELLVRLPDGMERNVELLAEAAGGRQRLVDVEMPTRDQVPELVDELLSDGEARIMINLQFGHAK
jgi:hypothetical protein